MAALDDSWRRENSVPPVGSGDTYLHGGGTTWMPGTYDPELDTLYWTTSNAAPDFEGDSRPGDDLYTACVLAIDPNNGKLKWYFQFTPHDLYDYDANETPVLVDQEENGVSAFTCCSRPTAMVSSMFSIELTANSCGHLRL